MSRKANPTIMGLFALGAVALLVGGVAIFGGGRFFRPTLKYVAFFEGTVSGLRKGSPVNFRGVRIGSVTDIHVRIDPKNGEIRIPVYFELEPDRITQASGARLPGGARARKHIRKMVDNGLRAHLATESFVTGQLAIEMDFEPDKPARYVGRDERFPEFPTVASTMEELTNTLKDLPLKSMLDRLDSTITGIDKLVNAPETFGTIKSLNLALADVRKLVQDVDAQVKPVAKSLTDTLADARKLIEDVEAQVKPIAKALTAALADARKLVKDVDAQVLPLAAGLIKTLAQARAALRQAADTLATAEGVIADDSKLSHEVSKALAEVSAAARAIRLTAEYLQRHPETLFYGKGPKKGR